MQGTCRDTLIFAAECEISVASCPYISFAQVVLASTRIQATLYSVVFLILSALVSEMLPGSFH